MSNTISQAVVRRLPRYYRYLGDLKNEGIDRVSSSELSKRMHVTASQIRQDLNNFGGFGQQGYGYNVDYLHKEIGHILGLDSCHNMIIIGAGNLGQAIANYARFSTLGFQIIALFDVKPELKGKTVRGIPILGMDELETFTKGTSIEIAALTIPKGYAIETAELLVKLGIKSIWNFAHVDLNLGDDIIVENVHLSDSLMQLSYSIEQNKLKSRKDSCS